MTKLTENFEMKGDEDEILLSDDCCTEARCVEAESTKLYRHRKLYLCDKLKGALGLTIEEIRK